MQHPLEVLPDGPDPGRPLRELGNRLAQARHAAQLSQQDAAEHCMVSADTLSRWERGKNEPGSLQIARLAEVYGVSADWVLGLVEHPNGLPSEHSVVDQGAVQQIRTAAEKGQTLRAVNQLIHPPGITCVWDIPEQPELVPAAQAAELNRQVGRWIAQIKKNR